MFMYFQVSPERNNVFDLFVRVPTLNASIKVSDGVCDIKNK
jgi:hypothetical protein